MDRADLSRPVCSTMARTKDQVNKSILREVFLRGTLVFPSPQKPTLPNSNSTRNQVDEEPLCGCATSKSLLLFYCYFSSYIQLNLDSSLLPRRNCPHEFGYLWNRIFFFTGISLPSTWNQLTRSFIRGLFVGKIFGFKNIQIRVDLHKTPFAASESVTTSPRFGASHCMCKRGVLFSHSVL